MVRDVSLGPTTDISFICRALTDPLSYHRDFEGRICPRLSRSLFCVAGIDRYAIAIRIDQLEVVVTIKLVLSNCIYRQSLFH
jgi:hypothetical protein